MTIYPKKLRLALMLLVAMGFVIGAVQVLATHRGPALPTSAFALAAIVFFGACAAVIARKVFSERPSLCIDDKGLTDHASALGVGLIPWRDISGVQIVAASNQRFLQVNVHAPQAYLARANPLQRRMMALSQRVIKTDQVIFLPQATLSVPLEDIARHIEQRLAEAR